jgi:hypothetical protein
VFYSSILRYKFYDFIFLGFVGNMASNPDLFNPDPDWMNLDVEYPPSGSDYDDEGPQPMDEDDEIDPDVDLPPMCTNDDPMLNIEEESRDESHNQEDRPVRYPAIDITEMIPPHDMDDCDPIDSGMFY